MESADRSVWQKPDAVIAALKLRPGERIADVGCGPGYFTLPLAEAVGPTGVVWAVDIKAEMLDRLREHIAESGSSNIKPHLVPEHDPQLPPGEVDTVFIVDTYHHFSNRSDYVSKLRRALAPGGRIVIIDFIPKSREERGFGPRLEMQLERATVDREMAGSKLQPAAVHTFLPEQYFIEYRVKE
jgi:ubiquinone/menaquinone biosynthesis C-methylase UbiE